MKKLMWMVAALTGAAGAVSPDLNGWRAPVETPCEYVKGFLWLEAEGFADYGAWQLDTQFTHKMGSAYLLACGVGQPVQPAATRVAFPRAGAWRVWVRTKDWLPEFSPGTFTVNVAGARGRTLGASKRAGWTWEDAGTFTVAAGAADVRLEDLSGAFARCDALLFTDDPAYTPPEDDAGVEVARLRFTGRDATMRDGGAYDVVVVGAGTAGMGAALAAARTGARTALVHDRPVLGGNSSSELGIGTDGAAGAHPNKNLHARETGLCEEANLVRGRTKTKTLSAAYRLMADAEANLTVFDNQRVMSVEKNGDTIAAVVARDTLTGTRTRTRAKIFIDCTGDGWVGYFAGAAHMYGREAQSEYGEWPAPETRDDLTMSGCLMDSCIAYRYERRPSPVAYTPPAWANVLPEGFTRHIRNISPQWWIEHGGRFDDLKDPERARDELVRISFAYWGWVKNSSPLKDDAKNAELTFVPFMNGRREGMRLTGDYVLTANDALAGRLFDDRVTYGGWPLDTHDPLGIENAKGNGYWKNHPGVPIYTIPYRCLYSVNVPNLMFAGRCQSVTHIALGSVRVEATLFTLGQAAGTAAALAAARGLSPRAFGQRHIRELQQRLLKDDQYIPGLVNEDPLDRARGARVTATSVQTAARVMRWNDAGLRDRDRTAHALTQPRATCFPRGLLERLERVECLVESARAEPGEMTLRLYESDAPAGGPTAGMARATARGRVGANQEGLVAFDFAEAVTLTKPYVWVELLPCKDTAWLLRQAALTRDGCRAWGNGKTWNVVSNMQYAVVTTPTFAFPVDSRPEYVIDGTARPVGDCTHAWISDPEQPLPQTVRLDFPQPVSGGQVRLTFDTDLIPTRVALYPPCLVKSYVVEGFDGRSWRTLAREERNDLRLRVHDFPRTELSAVRVTVRETWGDPSARIFEVRVY